MDMMTAAKAAELAGAELVRGPSDNEITEVVRDSRDAVDRCIFVALVGEKNDGHNFVEQAYENGCRV